MGSLFRNYLPMLLVAVLAGCSGGGYVARDGAPRQPVDVSHVPDAVPQVAPRSRYGNPDSYVVRGKRYYVMDSAAGYVERGIASWYGTKFHGRRTSSGEPYDMYAMTAAHKTLPLPTWVRVTNLRNGRSVVVKVNDRGPFHHNRIIDLSYAAAVKLGIQRHGTGLVEVRALDPRRPEPVTRVATRPEPALPEPPATGNAALWLQVGAFSSRYNAERLSERLRQAALPGDVHISTGYSRQQPVFRVRIGPLSDVEEADRVSERLAALGVQNPHVVID